MARRGLFVGQVWDPARDRGGEPVDAPSDQRVCWPKEPRACDGHLRARLCDLRRWPIDESAATRSVPRTASRQHMNFPYGQTRTRVAARHALIAPDGHVK